MPASFELSESNGVGEDVTDGITTLNFGNVDAPDLVVATYPIPIPGNAFEKFIRVHVTGTFSKVDNIKIWKSAGAYLTGESIQTNLKIAAYTAESYAQPSITTFTDQGMPTSEPGSANLGIGGALDGYLDAPGYSDYWKAQLQFAGTRPAGNSNTFTYTWECDEQ